MASYLSIMTRSNKVHFKSLEEKMSGAFLDLDMLSGFTELSVEGQDDNGVSRFEKLGVYVQPFNHERCVPSQLVCIVPRYIISNESMEAIVVRQCYAEVLLSRLSFICENHIFCLYGLSTLQTNNTFSL